MARQKMFKRMLKTDPNSSLKTDKIGTWHLIYGPSLSFFLISILLRCVKQDKAYDSNTSYNRRILCLQK